MCEEGRKEGRKVSQMSKEMRKKRLIYRFYVQEFSDAEVLQDAKGEIGR